MKNLPAAEKGFIMELDMATTKKRETEPLPPGHFWDPTKGLMHDLETGKELPPPTEEEMTVKRERLKKAEARLKSKRSPATK